MSWIKKNWTWLMPVCVALALLVTCGSFLERNRSLERQLSSAHQNITALTDTLHTAVTKNGDLLVTIAGYESSVKDLKHLSEDLAAQIEDYKKSTKNNVQTAVSAETVTVLPEKEVVFVRDSVELHQPLDFSDEWRTLTGELHVTDTVASVLLNPETIHARFTAGLDEAGTVFIKTDNPYVRVISLEGFTVPKPKKNRWGIGVHVGYGYDFASQKFGPDISVGLQYSIITF